jgi:glycosyltransferase involved in cell wall biosynthesis
MRLLFLGDLAATGFGTVTSDLGNALLHKGMDVRFLSQNEFGELPEPFLSRTLDLLTYIQTAQGIDMEHSQPFIPRLLAGDGTELFLASGEPWGHWQPDAVLLLGDFYGVRLIVAPQIDEFAKIPTYHYCPVEGHSLPPVWNEIWSVVQPIAMSKFGQTEMAKVIGHLPPLMYHGVDSEAFKPVSITDPVIAGEGKIFLSSKERCKAFFGVHPKARMVLRTDRNMPRKGYPALLRAMEPVMRERDDVVLVLHCRATDQGGFLHDSISKMDPKVRARVMTPEWGPLPRYGLRALYNAADLYVSTSAEGFGLTIAEAIACGTPAVGLDYSAVPEVIGPAGKTVPVGRLLDNEYGHHWALPDEDAFGRTVAYLLDHPARARELGAQGPKHVRATFTWDAAADVMLGLLEPQRELVAV